MAVPEAAVDEDGLATGGENQVGGPGQALVVEPVSEARSVQQPADDHFWPRVPCAHQSHALAAFAWR